MLINRRLGNSIIALIGAAVLATMCLTVKVPAAVHPMVEPDVMSQPNYSYDYGTTGYYEDIGYDFGGADYYGDYDKLILPLVKLFDIPEVCTTSVEQNETSGSYTVECSISIEHWLEKLPLVPIIEQLRRSPGAEQRSYDDYSSWKPF